MAGLTLSGGLALLPGHESVIPADIVIDEGGILAIHEPASPQLNGSSNGSVMDVAGAWVLPGIVDIHGDAFERAVMPRGGVAIDVASALADNDAHLLAAGITTAYLSMTDSWEPGLRSRETLRELLEANDLVVGGPDRRIHVRHERCNTEDFDELLGWIAKGRIHMMSYNDHTPGGIANVSNLSATQLSRTGLGAADLEARQGDAIKRRPIGFQQDQLLAGACREAGVVTASHDSDGDEDFARDLALGVDIAEFPLTIDLCRQYLAAGIHVLLGAPNLVRGASHLGNLSVRDAVARQAGTVLCSDYHYPSLLRAPFVLSDLVISSFGDAWKMVSESPAEAGGLVDRGRLEIGARADVIVVEPGTSAVGPRVQAAFVGGHCAYQALR